MMYENPLSSTLARLNINSKLTPFKPGLNIFAEHRTTMERSKASIRRCAIYARKSSEEGLEQDLAETRAQEQIQSLSLKATTIPPNGTESGYVFFPLGEYQKI
jgi:hypothetical protein